MNQADDDGIDGRRRSQHDLKVDRQAERTSAYASEIMPEDVFHISRCSTPMQSDNVGREYLLYSPYPWPNMYSTISAKTLIAASLRPQTPARSLTNNIAPYQHPPFLHHLTCSTTRTSAHSRSLAPTLPPPKGIGRSQRRSVMLDQCIKTPESQGEMAKHQPEACRCVLNTER